MLVLMYHPQCAPSKVLISYINRKKDVSPNFIMINISNNKEMLLRYKITKTPAIIVSPNDCFEGRDECMNFVKRLSKEMKIDDDPVEPQRFVPIEPVSDRSNYIKDENTKHNYLNSFGLTHNTSTPPNIEHLPTINVSKDKLKDNDINIADLVKRRNTEIFIPPPAQKCDVNTLFEKYRN